MSNELKPCPFCGGPGYLCQIPSASGGERYIWVAKCSLEDGCGVEFLGTSRKVDAINEWNRRVKPRKHIFWAAGEPDCPREIKARNGELHTLRCKICGKGPRDLCQTDATAYTEDTELAVLRDENKRLAKEVAAANKGAKINALVNQRLAGRLKIAEEALENERDYHWHIAQYDGNDMPEAIKYEHQIRCDRLNNALTVIRGGSDD